MGKNLFGKVTHENARIYLQGEFAIATFKLDNNKAILTIGSSASLISVIDYRPATFDLLKEIIADEKKAILFADIFNQNGEIAVKIKKGDRMEIVIRPESAKLPPATSLLYLGVIWDETFPNVDSAWEKFTPIKIDGQEVTAFCSLVLS